MALLTIVIGLIFVMLLFSLLASAVVEILSSITSLRAKDLRRTLTAMLQSQTGEFFKHPYFQQLRIGSNTGEVAGNRRRPLARVSGERDPSYISPEVFGSIVTDSLTNTGMTPPEAVSKLPEGQFKEMMSFIVRNSGQDKVAFQKGVEEWFNKVMERASGSFKRSMQMINFLVGLSIAVIFNVDVLTIYYNLSVNSALSDFVADTATAFVQSGQAEAYSQQSPDMQSAAQEVSSLVNNNIKVLESPLGIGWSQVNVLDINEQWWLYHIIGWLTTAFCITMGSPFWFDLLKYLVGMRGGSAQKGANTTVVVQPPNNNYPPATSTYPTDYNAPAGGYNTPAGGYNTPAGGGGATSPYDVPAQPSTPAYTTPATPSPQYLPPTDIPNDVNPFDDMSSRLDNN